jgi:hypothetical protein
MLAYSRRMGLISTWDLWYFPWRAGTTYNQTCMTDSLSPAIGPGTERRFRSAVHEKKPEKRCQNCGWFKRDHKRKTLKCPTKLKDTTYEPW